MNMQEERLINMWTFDWISKCKYCSDKTKVSIFNLCWAIFIWSKNINPTDELQEMSADPVSNDI